MSLRDTLLKIVEKWKVEAIECEEAIDAAETDFEHTRLDTKALVLERCAHQIEDAVHKIATSDVLAKMPSKGKSYDR